MGKPYRLCLGLQPVNQKSIFGPLFTKKHRRTSGYACFGLIRLAQKRQKRFYCSLALCFLHLQHPLWNKGRTGCFWKTTVRGYLRILGGSSKSAAHQLAADLRSLTAPIAKVLRQDKSDLHRVVQPFVVGLRNLWGVPPVSSYLSGSDLWKTTQSWFDISCSICIPPSVL